MVHVIQHARFVGFHPRKPTNMVTPSRLHKFYLLATNPIGSNSDRARMGSDRIGPGSNGEGMRVGWGSRDDLIGVGCGSDRVQGRTEPTTARSERGPIRFRSEPIPSGPDPESSRMLPNLENGSKIVRAAAT